MHDQTYHMYRHHRRQWLGYPHTAGKDSVIAAENVNKLCQRAAVVVKAWKAASAGSLHGLVMSVFL